MGLKNKINTIGYSIPENFAKFLGEDFVALSFYLVLSNKYIFDRDLTNRCIRISNDIWGNGFPSSTKELKEITDIYFKNELEKSTLDILFYHLNNETFPKGVII